jgi:predicted AlkP superfamily phosphohydrolase/phosphomutase
MKIFLLGIDGLTFQVLDPLIEKGYLPNFARLKQEGSWGILRSTIPPITPAAWMSIATGLKPAKHGTLDFLDIEWLDNRIQLAQVTRRKSGQAIWNILNSYGRRVAVANIPCTYPPDIVSGVMVSGFSTPSSKSAFTYPRAFRDELFKAVPDYQIDIMRTDQSEEHSRDELLSLVQNMTDRRIELLDFLIVREAWDFIFFTFVGADRIQHEFWDQIIKGESSQIIEYYRMLDGILTRVMDWVGDDGLLLIVSDHGFRGANRVCHINQLLGELGLVEFNFPVRVKNLAVPLLEKLRLMKLMNSLYTMLMPQSNKGGSLASDRLLGPIAIDHSKMWALAYARSVYASLFCPLSLSRDDAEDLLATVIAELRDLGVVSDEVYIGETLRTALGFGDEAWGPQAILMANAPWAFQGRPRPGKIAEITKTVGIHDMDGCLLVWGQGVKAGPLTESASVFDIAPTILYAFDLPMQSDFDGHPLTDMFTFKRRLRVRDKMTGAVWEEAQRSKSVRKKLDKLLREGKQG